MLCIICMRAYINQSNYLLYPTYIIVYNKRVQVFYPRGFTTIFKHAKK